jgi:hypothetical protein
MEMGMRGVPVFLRLMLKIAPYRSVKIGDRKDNFVGTEEIRDEEER